MGSNPTPGRLFCFPKYNLNKDVQGEKYKTDYNCEKMGIVDHKHEYEIQSVRQSNGFVSIEHNSCLFEPNWNVFYIYSSCYFVIIKFIIKVYFVPHTVEAHPLPVKPMFAILSDESLYLKCLDSQYGIVLQSSKMMSYVI